MRDVIVWVVGVVVLGLLALPAQATLVDSNSIIQDGIEYYFQTDKSIYDLGENVEMLYRVTNLGDEYIQFHFGNSLMHDFGVTDISTMQEIWRLTYVDTSWAARIPDSFILQPGQSQEFNRIWNQTTDSGTTDLSDDIPIGTGNYEVTGMLFYGYTHDGRYEGPYYVPVSVQIDIIPEPATVVLLAAGGLSVFGRVVRA